MPTLSTSPPYQVPGQEMLVSFTATNLTCTFVRIWCTSAPTGSELDARLRKNQSTRELVFEGEVTERWKFTPDVGGTYNFAAQEYKKGDGFRGGYLGDPAGAQTETAVGGEESLTLNAGQRATFILGAAGDESELVVFVWDATIRETTEKLHGEASPRIDAGGSDRAKNAARATAMAALLASIPGTVAATFTGDLDTISTALVIQIDQHIAAAPTVHDNADSDNHIGPEYAGPFSEASFIASMGRWALYWQRHAIDDAGDGDGPGAADYHPTPDNLNRLIAQSPSTLADAVVTLADLIRVHQLHRLSTTYHNGVDAYTLGARPLLLQIHEVYLTAIAAQVITPSPVQQTGIAYLVSWGGKTD